MNALVTAIPSPPQAVWYLGAFPLRAYALAILAGIVAAVWIAQRRMAARGGPPERVIEIAFWAVPFGIVGGRIYHVVSSPQAYFGPGGDPWRAFAIWEGGLGIWGAIAFGAVGAAIGARQQNIRLASFADVVAPALLVAQAIGRLGNWFNQELFGGPTTLPWGLQIDAAHLPPGFAEGTLFHPTFLYELVWNLVGAAVLVWADRRFRLGNGQVFWLYVMIYTAGRGWIETVRIDPASIVLGMRLNVWTSLLVGVLALVAFIVTARRFPGREASVYREPEPAEGVAEGAHDATAPAGDEEPRADTRSAEGSSP